jgi:hypothetical protein
MKSSNQKTFPQRISENYSYPYEKRFSMIVAPMGEYENCEEVLKALSFVPKIVPKKPFRLDRYEICEDNKVRSCYFYFSTPGT